MVVYWSVFEMNKKTRDRPDTIEKEKDARSVDNNEELDVWL